LVAKRVQVADRQVHNTHRTTRILTVGNIIAIFMRKSGKNKVLRN
jgi:hypothetical protein